MHKDSIKMDIYKYSSILMIKIYEIALLKHDHSYCFLLINDVGILLQGSQSFTSKPKSS